MAIRSIARTTRDFVESRTGVRIQGPGVRGTTLGTNLRQAGIRIDSVFDVGAHWGESASRFRRWFPDADIYCFEPDRASNARCREVAAGLPRVTVLDRALGAAAGRQTFYEYDRSHNSSLKASDDDSLAATTTEVSVDTVDNTMESLGLIHLGLLKVDTEGGDLDVVKGACRALQRRAIAAVQVEAGMTCLNRKHVPFEAFTVTFERYGYALFGVYDQVAEYGARHQHLRRADLVFIPVC